MRAGGMPGMEKGGADEMAAGVEGDEHDEAEHGGAAAPH
jgi:hypothetical protein